MNFEDLDPKLQKVIADAIQERIAKELAEKEPLVAATWLLDNGRAALLQGSYVNAVHATEAAIDILRPRQDDEALGLLAQALNNLGEAQKYLGQENEALRSYDASLRLARYCKRPEFQSAILSNRGSVLLKLKRIAEAVKSQELALQIDISNNDITGQGYSHHNLAFALREEKRVYDAIPHAKRAVEIRELAGDHDELITSYLLLSGLLRESGKAQDALIYLRKALASRPFLTNPRNHRLALIELVDTLENCGPQAEYIAALEELIEEVEQLRHTIDDKKYLEDFERRYNRHYEKAIGSYLAAGQYDKGFSFIARTKARTFLELYRTDSALQSFSELEHTSYADIVKYLDPDEILVDFWITPKRTCACLITVDKIQYSMRDNRCRDFFLAIKELLQPGPLTSEFGESLNDQTIESLKAFFSSRRRLYLVPHGVQFFLPFSAIRTGHAPPYLCQSTELVILPSAAFLPLCKMRPTVDTRNCLVVGDPDGSLPYARREAEMVGALLGCAPLIGDVCTRERVLNILHGGNFDVVHLACHFHQSPLGRANSGLAMAAGGVITVEDLARVKVNANVVVAASCWSGLVDFSAWNNFVGLPRALLLSGANNVVSSIGPLSDEASCEAFKHFYTVYRSGPNSASYALMEAQRALIRAPAFAHPRNWATLYSTGKAN